MLATGGFSPTQKYPPIQFIHPFAVIILRGAIHGIGKTGPEFSEKVIM